MRAYLQPDWLAGTAIDGIVRASDLQELVQRQLANGRAEALLEAARSQAQELLKSARREADALLAQATEKMESERQRGYAEGQAQAVAEWHQRHADVHAQTAAALKGLDMKIADIVTQAVQRIVLSEPLEAMFARALENVRGLIRDATAMSMRVSAADLEQARCAVDLLNESQPLQTEVTLSADADLAPGSCVFESDTGVLDASLDFQLRGLRAALLRAVNLGPASAEPEAGAALSTTMQSYSEGSVHKALDGELQP